MRAEVQKRLPKEWSEEETAQLTELWTQFKDDDGNFFKFIFPKLILLFPRYAIFRFLWFLIFPRCANSSGRLYFLVRSCVFFRPLVLITIKLLLKLIVTINHEREIE